MMLCDDHWSAVWTVGPVISCKPNWASSWDQLVGMDVLVQCRKRNEVMNS